MSEEVVAAIGISYSVQTGDGRNMVFQTHIAQSASDADRDALIDKLRTSADRQVTFGKIEAIDTDLEQQERLLRQVQDGIAAVDENYKAKKDSGLDSRMPKAEITARENAVKSLEHHHRAIETLKAKQEKLRASLG